MLLLFQDSSEKLRYNDPSLPIYAVTGDLVSFEGLRARCHWHADVEFLLPIKGHLRYRVNNREYTIEEGQAIFVNSRRMHYGFSINGEDCIYLCIVFPPSLLSASDALYQKYFEPLLSSDNFDAFILNCSVPLHQQLMTKLQELCDLYAGDVKDPELIALSLLSSLWKDLYQIYAAEHQEQPISNRQDAVVLKEILGYMYQHFSDKITLADLSRAGGVSRTKCCELFKTYFDSSPIAYLNNYRLDRSIELLRNSENSIVDISDNCGFSNSSYFAEMFKARMGCSPTAYRNL